jgi:hypothetical protein
MPLTPDENRLVDSQIKAYQNIIEFVRKQIKNLKEKKGD